MTVSFCTRWVIWAWCQENDIEKLRRLKWRWQTQYKDPLHELKKAVGRTFSLDSCSLKLGLQWLSLKTFLLFWTFSKPEGFITSSPVSLTNIDGDIRMFNSWLDRYICGTIWDRQLQNWEVTKIYFPPTPTQPTGGDIDILGDKKEPQQGFGQSKALSTGRT